MVVQKLNIIVWQTGKRLEFGVGQLEYATPFFRLAVNYESEWFSSVSRDALSTTNNGDPLNGECLNSKKKSLYGNARDLKGFYLFKQVITTIVKKERSK